MDSQTHRKRTVDWPARIVLILALTAIAAAGGGVIGEYTASHTTPGGHPIVQFGGVQR